MSCVRSTYAGVAAQRSNSVKKPLGLPSFSAMGSFLGPVTPSKYVPPFKRQQNQPSPQASGLPSPAASSTPAWGQRRQNQPSPPASGLPSPPASRQPSPVASTTMSWRQNAAPPQCLSFGALELGGIMLLGAHIPQSSRFYQHMVENGMLGVLEHPVLITAKFIEAGTGTELVRFRVCTSFGGKSILGTTKTRHSRSEYLLIKHPSRKAHDETRELALANGCHDMPKPTYINVQPGAEYEIEYQHLSRYATRDKDFVLNEQSFAYVQSFW